MKKLLSPLILIMALTVSCKQTLKSKEVIQDLNSAEFEVRNAVDALNDAIVNPDLTILERYTDEQLRYGHSAGFIEDKKTFIESLTSGKYNFIDVDVSGQIINMLDISNAVVEHVILAKTHDANKEPSTVKLKILQIWHNDMNGWRLVARQGVKL